MIITTTTTEPTYKYESAQAWLIQYLGTLSHADLLQEAFTFAQQLDGDEIQDLYQSEMDADGYFTPLKGQL